MADISFRQLDYSFIENYDYYLRIECVMMPNTVLHKTTALRKMTRQAIARGIIDRDPFTGYKPERPQTQQRYLPQDELAKLMTATLDPPHLHFTRDMFVFACFTGLSYIDLYNLTHDQVVRMDDGSLWIMINRQKTGNASNIPLLDTALQIMEKYRGIAGDNRVFPMTCCSTLNGHLKKIAGLCGIERRLSFHCARYNTFSYRLK